jgi:phosphate transport system substrate-binding protein
METDLRRIALLAAAAALAVMLAGRNADAQSKETILRIHGSNTIGAAVAPDMAAAFLKKLGADNVEQTEITPGTEMDVEGHFSGKNQVKVIEIRAHGSSTAFKSLKEKQCDIGMASRKIKEEEVKDLTFLGDMTGAASEHVLAVDGVAVIVNTANAAVSKLDFTGLADLFSGKIKNWSELGGPDAPVVIHARDEKSGTHDTFQHLVLGKKELAASAKRHESTDELSAAVNADMNAVGYCGLSYVRHNKALAVSDGGSAVRPTIFTVASEDYPVSRRLYLYTPAMPSNPHTQPFIAFALGKEGQDIVRRHKLVDLTVSAEDFKVEVTGGGHNYQVLYKYLNAVRGAKRLSSSFRFKGETMALDNRAVRDMERLTDFLAENRAAEIILAGFSDSKGGDAQNLELSCQRARAVEEELRSRGIKAAEVLCVGQEVPTASNETEAGREKNRRVEVWIKK